MKRYVLLIYILCILMTGCQDTVVSSKPRAYPKIEYPVRKYIAYANEECPFIFEYPDYVEIKKKEENIVLVST